MPKQVLAILERLVRRPLPSRLPRRVVDFGQRPRIVVFGYCVNEYIHGMQPANALDDGFRHPIEHDEAFLAILDALGWNDEHRGLELRYLHLIVPLQSAEAITYSTSSHDRHVRHEFLKAILC
jgi:hypothetical protein